MDKLNINRFAKNEILSSFPDTSEQMTAYLSAAVKAAGSLRLIKRRSELIIEAQDYDYIMSVVRCVKELYKCEVDIDVTNVNTGIIKGRQYSIKLTAGITDSILHDCGVIYDTKQGYSFTSGVPDVFSKNPDLAKNYLKSLFIAVGQVGVPTKIIGEDEDIESSGNGYYLEFSVTDDVYAAAVKKLLSAFDITAKITERGNKFVTYVKESEAISNFFALLSCSDTVLYMQDIMVERMLNNNVNRKSNCEVANMDKTAIASTKQILAIEAVDRLYGLGRLKKELRELADMRLENPTGSLEFFASSLGVSKSCINHRFRKIVAMAEELKNENAPSGGEKEKE